MFTDLLYGFVIKPIELLIELVFSLVYKINGNPGIAIIFVSLAVQLLVLPMYKRSDALQEEERKKQQVMKPWVDHIKKTFKGDERFMMIQAYYREVGYKPSSSIKGSLSLLLQIPFFIAAYNYLSNLEILKGASFGFLADLGTPDGLIVMGGISLNLLPILMTVFNIVSGIIYTKGFPLKDKVQTFGLALIFLVLLYNCPSGLVLYWTLNNLFSLLKNVVMKLFFKNEDKEKETDNPPVSPFVKGLFTACSIILTVFLGCIIPLSVIGASPVEFINKSYGPMGLMLNTLAVFAGIFLLWMRIFFILSGERGKKVFTCVMAAISVSAIINHYATGRNLGNMTPYLIYDNQPAYPLWIMIVGIVVLTLCFVFVSLMMKKREKTLKQLYQIGAAAMVVIAAFSAFSTYSSFTESNKGGNGSADDKIFTLSKNGRNVIVFMVDRAISGFIPFHIKEKPELVNMYDGFTFYSNTVAFGSATNYSTPSLFGGYEYTPEEINKRKDQTLLQKHNEALTVMPKLFLDNNYSVTVSDPPWAGLQWIPDLSIYDKYPGIRSFITEGVYSGDMAAVYGVQYEKKQKHNFIYYSIMRGAPAAVRNLIYDKGEYLAIPVEMNISQEFINAYSALTKLPDLTEIKDDSSDNFLMMQNSTPHAMVMLHKPDYTPGTPNRVPEEILSGMEENGLTIRLDTAEQKSLYDTNMAAILRIGEWLDFLKKQGVYDNTRIIICSDHGWGCGQFDNLLIDPHNNREVSNFAALLMVKDFGDKGFKSDDTFMTLADIPTLATKGVIDSPINPFTGHEINSDPKSGELHITAGMHWMPTDSNGYTFNCEGGAWWSVRGNIYDTGNWKRLREGLENE